MKTCSILIVGFLFLMMCANVQAQIPKSLSYQGVLTDSLGTPKPDGSYTITFRLYDAVSGGTALWTEQKTLLTKRGLFSTILGDQTLFGSSLLFDRQYWLSIQVAAGAELSPRIPLSSMGYSLNSLKADTALYAKSIAIAGVTNAMLQDGAVTQSKILPGVTLPPSGNARGDLSGTYPSPLVAKIQSRTIASAAPTDGQVLKWNQAATQWAPAADAIGSTGGSGLSGQVSFWNTSTSLSGTNNLFWDNTNSRLGIGTSSLSGSRLDIKSAGNSFTVLNAVNSGSANSLFSIYQNTTGDGVAYFNNASGGIGAQIAGGINNHTFFAANGGNVGIGTTNPRSVFHVKGSPGFGVVRVSPAVDNNTSEIGLFSDAAGISTNTAWLVSNGGWGNTGKFVIGNENGGAGGDVRLTIEKNGNIGIGTTTPTSLSKLHVRSNARHAGYFTTDSISYLTHVIHAELTNRGQYSDGVGVFGSFKPAPNFGIGGQFEGGYIGAKCIADTGGGGNRFGVMGTANNGAGANYGFFGTAWGGATSYGIYASAVGGITNYAGYFEGNVSVTGDLNVSGSKSFRIDHPLDPANKFLFHSCVESNDQMNVYNGNVTLDGKGEAVVSLPIWFEALNKDFRYQLTCIGGFAQVYIAEKVSNNRFKIAGGSSGLEVSWQVTGIRKDAYVNAHRMQVEVDKPASERGKYIHPVENGAPESMGIGYDQDRKPR